MKSKYLNKLVEIEWLDAHHLTASWLTLEEIAEQYKKGDYVITNVGWVIGDFKDYIVLASKKDHCYEQYGGVMFIPKGIVRKTKLL